MSDLMIILDLQECRTAHPGQLASKTGYHESLRELPLNLSFATVAFRAVRFRRDRRTLGSRPEQRISPEDFSAEIPKARRAQSDGRLFLVSLGALHLRPSPSPSAAPLPLRQRVARRALKEYFGILIAPRL